TTHAPGRSAPPMSCSTAGTTSGLTATMTVSACAAASRLPAARTPYRCATRRARSSSASATNTSSGATSAACTMPPTSASPMAPTPMQASVPAMSAFHLEVVVAFQRGGLRHFDDHVAGREQEQRLAEPHHAPVQRVGRAADEVHQPPRDLLRDQLHGQNDGTALFQAVGHHLHVVEAGGPLHHHAQQLPVAAPRAGQAHQPAPPGFGRRLAGQRRLRGLGISRGRLLLFDPEKIEHLVDKSFVGGRGLAHGVLFPNSAVPIRTMVDPSSTATSKSLVIPMDRQCMCTHWMSASATCSRSSRSRRNTGRTVSGSSAKGAMAIRPSIRRPGSLAISRTKSSTRSGATPCFVASPATLTCTSTGTSTPSAVARRDSASPRDGRSSE